MQSVGNKVFYTKYQIELIVVLTFILRYVTMYTIGSTNLKDGLANGNSATMNWVEIFIDLYTYIDILYRGVVNLIYLVSK